MSRPAAEGLAGPALLYAGAPLALPRPLAELPGALVQALEPLDPLGHVARPLGPGVLSLDERLWFVLPRCYRPPPGGEAPGAEAMLLTLSVLARYRRERPQGAVLRRQDPLALVEAGEPGGALDHLEAGLALWADWRERGPLVLARARRSAVEPGRTHWPATVRSGQPVGSGGQIFARQIRTRVRPDPQNELARLHLSTVAEAARALGAPGPRPPAEPGAPPRGSGGSPPRSWTRRSSGGSAASLTASGGCSRSWSATTARRGRAASRAGTASGGCSPRSLSSSGSGCWRWRWATSPPARG